MGSRFNESFIVKALILIVLGVIFLVYIPSLGGELITDDIALIEKKGIPDFNLNILTYIQEVKVEIPPYYRPFTSFTLAIEQSIYKPYIFIFGFHLVNVLIYLGSILLVYFVMRKFGFSKVKSLFGMALFAALPIHVQAVCWISGRADCLCLFFFLLALLFHQKNTKVSKVAALFTTALAVLSKETAIIIPVVFFCVDKYFLKDDVRIKKYIGYLLVVFVFLIIRFSVTGFVGTNYALPYGSNVVHGFLMKRLILGTQYNMWGLFVTMIPYKLSLYYPAISLGFWVSFSSVLLWGLVGILIWRTKLRWILMVIIATMFPTLGFVITSIVSDRYMLIPSFFVVLCVVKLIPKKKALQFATVLILFLVYLCATNYYVGDWTHKLEFDRRWIQRYNTPKSHFSYAAALNGVEGSEVPQAYAKALYHYYYGEELYRQEGKVPIQSIAEIKESVLKNLRMIIGVKKGE